MGPLEIIVRGHLTAQHIARTWQLARRCGLPTTEMRTAMLRLERKGIVRRHPRYSAVNDICWALVEDGTTERQPSPRDEQNPSASPKEVSQ